MNHTLLSKNTWEICGTYYDINHQPILAEGKYTFEQHHHHWTSEMHMLMHSNPNTEFRITYYINPLTDKIMTWESQNSLMGTFCGKLTVIDDTIVSTYESTNLIYTGVESFYKINDTAYHSNCYFLKGSQRISSWSVNIYQVTKSNKKLAEKREVTL